MASELFNIIGNIEDNKEQIVDRWISIPSIRKVFKQQHIGPKKFKKNFGIQILEYFIGVVKKENEVGDCPVMSRLVKYLIERYITPNDVFKICMGLRKELVGHIFEANLLKNNIKDTLDDISDLFDANLAGVLDIFTDLYKEQQCYIVETKERESKLKQFSKIINFIHTKIIIVKDGKIIMANKSFMGMVGEKNLKYFYKNIHKHQVENKEKNVYNLTEIDNWLKDVCVDDNTFNVNIFHDNYQRVFTYNARVTEINDDIEIKYIISLNNVSRFIDENKELKRSIEYDHLTGFYNRLKFETLLNNEKLNIQSKNQKAALGLIEIVDNMSDDNIIELADNIKNFNVEAKHLARMGKSRIAMYIPFDDKQSCYDLSYELYKNIYSKKYRIVFALSWFDISETISVSLLNIYSLIEKAILNEDRKIITDFEDIKERELLEDQYKFINAIKNMIELEIVVLYKELPIVSKSKVISTAGESVVLYVSQKMLITSTINCKVYFSLPSIGNIKADIKNILKNENKVVINNFRVSKHSPINRDMFRVKADEELKVKIIYEDEILIGSLLDLNIKYISVILDKKKNIIKGTNLNIELYLHMDDKEYTINSRANIEKIQKTDDGFKIVLACKYSTEDHSLISHYISLRQMHIVQEIQQISL